MYYVNTQYIHWFLPPYFSPNAGPLPHPAELRPTHRRPRGGERLLLARAAGHRALGAAGRTRRGRGGSMGVPKMDGLFHGKSENLMDDDWGYPHFRKPSCFAMGYHWWYTLHYSGNIMGISMGISWEYTGKWWFYYDKWWYHGNF